MKGFEGQDKNVCRYVKRECTGSQWRDTKKGVKRSEWCERDDFDNSVPNKMRGSKCDNKRPKRRKVALMETGEY